MYDLTIIGGGPAGVSAGVYAARKQLKTAFITESFGGQSIVSESIENWIGTPTISGLDLAKSLETHLKTYAKDIVDIHTGVRVTSVGKIDGGFSTTLSSGKNIESKTVLITVGSTRRKLTVEGADKYEHKGVTYCASCDGPLYSGTDVAVIGGGNAAFETAAQLLAYCKSVTLFNRSSEFRADPVTVEKVLSHPNMKAIKNVELLRVEGEQFVNSMTYKTETGEVVTMPVAGIFVEIGLIPSTDFAKDIVERTEIGKIVTDPRTQQTSTKGVWAAGDCTDTLYHQNNIAAGDAVRALEDIYVNLRTK